MILHDGMQRFEQAEEGTLEMTNIYFDVMSLLQSYQLLIPKAFDTRVSFGQVNTDTLRLAELSSAPWAPIWRIANEPISTQFRGNDV